MGRKSKAARRKAAGIANACGFHHSESRISELIPDAEMNATTMPKTSQSPGLSDPENEANNEQIILEGPRDSPLGSETGCDVSEAKINQYFESEDEDEQGYIRQGEELEDIYGDDELSELEGDGEESEAGDGRSDGKDREKKERPRAHTL